MPEQLVDRPDKGRTFTADRRVRLADVSPRGRVRLDAVARYLQDVSSDDTADAALADADAWVVRRTVIRVGRPAVYREKVVLTTWCSGIGTHWAERRVAIVGESGGAIDAATLWVSVDPASGRPRRLGEEFAALFGEAAGGRRVGARLELGAQPTTADARRPWPLRFADYDLLGHVNNAAYWAAVEEELSRRRDVRAPFEAVMEFGAGIALRASAELVVVDEAEATAVWMLVAGRVAAAARVVRL